jgi:hypothetical protein
MGIWFVFDCWLSRLEGMALLARHAGKKHMETLDWWCSSTSGSGLDGETFIPCIHWLCMAISVSRRCSLAQGIVLRLLESALFKVKIFDVVSSVVGLGADSAHIFPFREALLLETTSCAPGVAKDDG